MGIVVTVIPELLLVDTVVVVLIVLVVGECVFVDFDVAVVLSLSGTVILALVVSSFSGVVPFKKLFSVTAVVVVLLVIGVIDVLFVLVVNDCVFVVLDVGVVVSLSDVDIVVLGFALVFSVVVLAEICSETGVTAEFVIL